MVNYQGIDFIVPAVLGHALVEALLDEIHLLGFDFSLAGWDASDSQGCQGCQGCQGQV